MDGDKGYENVDSFREVVKKIEEKLDKRSERDEEYRRALDVKIIDLSESIVKHETKLNNGILKTLELAQAQLNQQSQLIELHKQVAKGLSVGTLFVVLSAIAVIVSVVSTL